jgi:hypothetical protein
MKLSVLISLAALLTGCERDTPIAIEDHDPDDSVSLAVDDSVVGDSSPNEIPPGWNESGFCIGIARIAADHSEKMNRESVLIGDVAYLFRGDYEDFKPGDIGKPIRVRGVMVEGRLPMFIASDDPEAPELSGIPMPPGTNLEEESRYYFIKDPKWEIITEQAEPSKGDKPLN